MRVRPSELGHYKRQQVIIKCRGVSNKQGMRRAAVDFELSAWNQLRGPATRGIDLTGSVSVTMNYESPDPDLG